MANKRLQANSGYLDANGVLYIDSSTGRVGLGTTSPSYKLDIVNTEASGDAELRIGCTNASNASGAATLYLAHGGSASNPRKIMFDRDDDSLIFYKGTTAQMVITSIGNVGIGTTTAGSNRLYVRQPDNTEAAVMYLEHAELTRPLGLQIFYSGTSPNSTDSEFIYCSDTTNAKFLVYSNGTCLNRTGLYNSISDQRLKENITDTNPKLADILKLKVRNFNFIGETSKYLGFIAQEVQEVFPGLVEQDTKSGYFSVKSSILVPMLVKAMQEQQCQIEALKAEICAIKTVPV